MSKKNLTLSIVAVVLVLGASFLFRSTISNFLSFGSPETPAPAGNTGTSTNPAPEKTGDNQPPAVSDKKTPVYTGRDPGEYRPVPEDVKVFNEDQKTRIFSSIQTHASAVKSDPRYFYGWIQIGILKKMIGDFVGARDAWEYASVIEPGNSLSFANLGELYWRYLHEYPKAEKNLRTSIEHKPDDVQTYVTLAELYHYSYKEKADLADDVLLEGIEKTGHESLMRRLAYLYEQRNEFPMALEWWTRILEANPNDEEIKKKIETLKSKVGAS